MIITDFALITAEQLNEIYQSQYLGSLDIRRHKFLKLNEKHELEFAVLLWEPIKAEFHVTIISISFSSLGTLKVELPTQSHFTTHSMHNALNAFIRLKQIGSEKN